MMPPMSIVTPEVFPIDYCRQVSDQSYQLNSTDSFDMPLGDFDPLPLHPAHGANDQLDAEQPTTVLSFESKSVPPAMQFASDYNALKRRRNILLRDLRMLFPQEDSYQKHMSAEMTRTNIPMIRPAKRARRTVTDGSNDQSMQEPTPVASQRSVPMAMKCDPEYLSDYQCLIRQQIEIFEASEEDVKSRDRGRNAAIYVGQVGIRCKHCASTPACFQSRGSSYFTSSMDGLYQAAQKMTTNHFSSNCLLIPESVKKSLLELKSDRRRAPGGKRYWSEGARILGVREMKNAGGLHFEKQNRQEVPEEVASATKKEIAGRLMHT